ncbi:Sialidase precursor [Planctomycetes bacterium K23_9]|uniref:exo-alpha-sialidase n=2 Tax=Stieleria marina TaxID=1930275 RepID=A0A517NRZ6_9BACT|nr:Sialidase precursor [Planctomycetes bacterium K23_9]
MQIVRDDGKHQAGNPCPLVDQQSGKIFLFYCGSRHSEGQVLGGAGSREVYLITSTDDGLSWSETRNLSASVKKPNWRWYATGPCSAIQIQSGKYAGRLIVPANHSIHFDDGRKWEYRCHSLYSDDHGETWQVGASSTAGGSETQIVEVAPDLLIQDIRMQTHRKGPRAVRFSRDGGATWDAIEYDVQRPCPKCQGSIIAIPAGEGDNLRLVSSNPAGKGRTHMAVYQSLDAGKKWQKISLLEAGPTGYSDLVVTADNRVACFFETGSKSPYESLVFQFVDDLR